MRIISPKLMLSFHGEDVFSKDSIMCLKLYEYNFEKSIFVGKKKTVISLISKLTCIFTWRGACFPDCASTKLVPAIREEIHDAFLY